MNEFVHTHNNVRTITIAVVEAQSTGEALNQFLNDSGQFAWSVYGIWYIIKKWSFLKHIYLSASDDIHIYSITGIYWSYM